MSLSCVSMVWYSCTSYNTQYQHTLFFLCRYTLIETMWYEDSEKRPSFSVILKSLNSMLHLEEAPVNEETSIISDSDETSPYISVTA